MAGAGFEIAGVTRYNIFCGNEPLALGATDFASRFCRRAAPVLYGAKLEHRRRIALPYLTQIAENMSAGLRSSIVPYQSNFPLYVKTALQLKIVCMHCTAALLL